MTEYAAAVGAPVWIDLMSSDVAVAAEFYSAVFGWEPQPANPEFGGYRNFSLNGNLVAGMMTATEGQGPANVWSVYLRTDDAQASIAAAAGAGAEVIVPAMSVGDLGRFGVFVDPVGAALGVWQPGTHAGFVERGVPGTPYWFDCQSKDYGASKDFYAKVFGWEYAEAGTGGADGTVGPTNYSQVVVPTPDGPTAVAGIMDSAALFAAGVYGADTSSFWQVYFTVDDIATAVERIVIAGGRILNPPEVTPWATMGAAADPLGAVFLFAMPPTEMA